MPSITPVMRTVTNSSIFLLFDKAITALTTVVIDTGKATTAFLLVVMGFPASKLVSFVFASLLRTLLIKLLNTT